MIQIEKARLREPIDVEDRILWGVAYDAGEQTINGRKWMTTLALDELGWLHIRRETSEGMKHARVPPDMIRAVFDAEPTAEEVEAELVAAKVLDPNWRHPKAVKR